MAGGVSGKKCYGTITFRMRGGENSKWREVKLLYPLFREDARWREQQTTIQPPSTLSIPLLDARWREQQTASLTRMVTFVSDARWREQQTRGCVLLSSAVSIDARWREQQKLTSFLVIVPSKSDARWRGQQGVSSRTYHHQDARWRGRQQEAGEGCEGR